MLLAYICQSYVTLEQPMKANHKIKAKWCAWKNCIKHVNNGALPIENYVASCDIHCIHACKVLYMIFRSFLHALSLTNVMTAEAVMIFPSTSQLWSRRNDVCRKNINSMTDTSCQSHLAFQHIKNGLIYTYKLIICIYIHIWTTIAYIKNLLFS